MDRKVERILFLYNELVSGKLISKYGYAEKFGVNIRTIQRDIDDIRSYYAEHQELKSEVIYDRKRKGYHLRPVAAWWE